MYPPEFQRDILAPGPIYGEQSTEIDVKLQQNLSTERAMQLVMQST
jgi:hypothetical protein